MIRKKLAYLYYERGWRFVYYKWRFWVLGSLFFWHRPKVKFILFSQGRSGSTLLSDLIDSSPVIKSDGEVFGAGMPLRVRFPKIYLDMRMRSFLSPVYGCKIKVYDLEKQHSMTQEQTQKFLRKRFSEGWKIIHLRRENKLRQALSSLVAEVTDTYHIGSKDHAHSKIQVPVEELPDRLRWLKEFDRWEDEAMEGFDRFEVRYERDLLNPENHQAVLDGIMKFLGLSPCEANTSYQRTSPTELRNYIQNYDEMVEVLRASGNAAYLEES